MRGGLNRTIVGLKDQSSRGNTISIDGLNRTIVGLKECR